jgi:poly(A) polymerase/tRNA nucleotidyltransferase (CCA-adding enzyme)
MYNNKFENIPKDVRLVAALLKSSGFQVFLVGGCVRDLLMDTIPKDYDITTDATPEQILSLFPRTFYNNKFGTVSVVTAPESEIDDQKVKDSIVEVTPFRLESAYSDNRHPDQVSWSKNVMDDLKRRDFTCNAIAYDIFENKIIDPFDGQKDIENKILRAVLDPDERFKEDALRMIRAVRFSAQLGFKIEAKTFEAIKNNNHLIENVSRERIRDEFIKIMLTDKPMEGIIEAHEAGVLKYISHEIEKGIGVLQNQAHKYDVWEHNLRTAQHSADKKMPLELRLSALFHDVSKPETRRFSHEKDDYTFYGHDVVGGRVAREIMERLKFPKETVDYVSDMVRYHMFFSDPEKVTLSAVRRLIVNIGKDRIWDLVNLRICDRVGTGRPKEEPYRFRKFQSMIEQAMTDPVSLKMLKITGEDIMSVTHEKPGKKIGLILHALFGEVIEDGAKNTQEYLFSRATELNKMDIKDIEELAKLGKQGMDEENQEEIERIKAKFHVK